MDGESTESRLNGDGSKEILAPTEGPRENLISTAVKFLQNPKVMSSPLYQKKAFLEKKGLTQEEINIAIQRSGVKETALEAAPGQENAAVYQPGGFGLNPQVPPGYYAPIPASSGWARARDLTVSTVVVASVSYAVYQLFQTYLRPRLFGKSFEERRLEKLERRILEIEKSVADSLAETNKILVGIQESLNKQNTQTAISSGELRGVSDIKADIASLKGLLLSKSQFPPAPSTSPVLPAWQRAQAPAVSASASLSYAEVVKTANSPNDDQKSTQQTPVSELADGHEPSQEPASIFASDNQINDSEGLTDSQDLSFSKLTESDSSLS
ncbi:unnamed protein product [Candidula unifasciata]|uniref:Peroxisomal membrane protein PEX14 n=1 Tax=Candidula unifasciata TaxID=100452 RepID=A0A8S3YLG3_9EUPU|nr:unnamed protein product [Candidula unifasciata]